LSTILGTASRPGRRRPARDAKRERPSERSFLHLDGGVSVAAIALISLGVVMSYSTTAPLDIDVTIPPLFRQHMLALAVGAASLALAMTVPLRLWQRLAIPIWGFGMVLLVLTAVIGVEANGAQRWLDLGFRFQPVEIVKFATLLVVSAAVAPRDGRRDLSNRRMGLALGLFTLPPVILLLFQPDLGNAVLLFGLATLLLVVAGRPLRHLLVPAAVAAVFVTLYVVSNDYARRRVEGFLDPWTQSQTSGFQLVQSFVAFGQGGLSGVGLGNGRQKLDYLFGAHTDFVLSLVAEELGLLGVLGVLGAFAALLITGSRVALRASDRFGLLLAFAMTSLLTVPALLNGAVVMGLVPTKGLTLPFLSYGGTSLVMCCVALGVLLGVARQTARARRGDSGARTHWLTSRKQ
jgi:cell division protein FtsW